MAGIVATGIMANDIGKASRLTVPGSGTDVARYRGAQRDELQAVVNSMGIATHRYAQAANQNPYARQIFELTRPVDVPGLGGLGDEDNNETSWLDVAKTFVGAVGTGIGNRISGTKTPTASMSMLPAPSTTPAWLMPVLLGGGALTLVLLLRRK